MLSELNTHFMKESGSLETFLELIKKLAGKIIIAIKKKSGEGFDLSVHMFALPQIIVLVF